MPSSPQTVPTVVLFDYLLNDAGVAIPNARVTVVLNSTVPVTTISPLTVLAQTQQSTTTDANGYWTFSLVPNTNIAPANTVYTVQTSAGTYDVTLGAVGPYQSTALGTIVNVPSALQAPANTTITGALNVGNLTVTAGEPGIDTIAAGALLLGDNTATSIEIGAPATAQSLFTAAAGEVISGGTGATLNASGDLAVRSVTVSSGSGPYTPILPTGSSAIYGHKFTFAPAGGTTDDGPNLQTLVNAAPANSIIEFQPGTYLINTTVSPKSNQAYVAAKGSVTLKRTVAGDIFGKAGVNAGTLTNVTWDGVSFDCTNTGWSAINIAGSDAAGQLSQITIRNCLFQNPSSTWMIQLAYTIVDPTIPVSKNFNLRIEDCHDNALGQTFTLENMIISNWQDVLISGNRFTNAPATLGAHVGIYGYNRNVRFVANYAENWLSGRAVYVQQSDSVQFMGDQFRTTASQNTIGIFNSKSVTVLGCDIVTANAGVGVQIKDFSGSTFDGHTAQYTESHNVRVQGNRMDVMTTCVVLDCINTQGQSDIFVEGNLVSPLRSLFTTANMPAAPSATVQRLFVRSNHVSSHSGFSGGSACVEIAGNALAANGGIQTVVVEGNLFAASGAGGTGCDIEVSNLADDIQVSGNRCLSSEPISIPAAITHVKVFSDNYINPVNMTPRTSALGANITSVTPNGAADSFRGLFTIVVAAGGLAANTRICTVSFGALAATGFYGATIPEITLVNQTSGVGLALVNFYVSGNVAGTSFDIASDQALVAGTYIVRYRVDA